MPIQSFNTSLSTSARPELHTFPPGLAWRLTNIVPIIALLALVPFVLSGGPSKESIPFAIVVRAFGPWIAVRSWISRVSYSRSEVHVVGLLWSRRIQLDDHISVETRASAPSILWQTKAGHLFRSPLTALASGYTILPSKVFRFRALYLEQLSLWASASQ